MSSYQKILAAIDLTEEADDVLTAAHEVCSEQNAELHIVTVIKSLTHVYGGYDMPAVAQLLVNFEAEAEAAAFGKIEAICERLGIAAKSVHVKIGRPADVVKTQAADLQADLIVVGTHGRQGLGMLLGSTANGILHGTPCDVLTVRIHNPG